MGTNAWVTGYHSCAIVQLQPGVQINPGDTVTVTTPPSWVNCGTGNAANQVVNFALGNYTGRSCFGTEALTKTLRIGFDVADFGPIFHAYYIIPMNWRYSLEWGSGMDYTVDGSVNGMWASTGSRMFQDTGMYTAGNGVDSAGAPGLSGYWALRYDDNSYSTSPTTLSIIAAQYQIGTATVIQDDVCTSVANPGVNGIGQFYMFKAEVATGSATCSIPLALQYVNAEKTPNISNVWIVGPGDFTYTEGQPLTADNFGELQSNPYALEQCLETAVGKWWGSNTLAARYER